ncbi:MAG: carbon storage regulator [Chloroflexota bacterium]
MLVLSRKKGERIVISEGIVVTVLDLHKSKVRLGIEAPEDMEVLREELTCQEENEDHHGHKFTNKDGRLV